MLSNLAGVWRGATGREHQMAEYEAACFKKFQSNLTTGEMPAVSSTLEGC